MKAFTKFLLDEILTGINILGLSGLESKVNNVYFTFTRILYTP